MGILKKIETNFLRPSLDTCSLNTYNSRTSPIAKRVALNKNTANSKLGSTVRSHKKV